MTIADEFFQFAHRKVLTNKQKKGIDFKDRSNLFVICFFYDKKTNVMEIALLNKDRCLNYFEFNITGDNDKYNKCDSESLYLDNDVFNLFSVCFENSHRLFEYYGETKYNPRFLAPLRNELMKYLEKLEKQQNFEDFEGFVKNIFLGEVFFENIERNDKNWRSHWQDYYKQLIKVNKDLIKLVENCIEEDRVLWVIGY